VLAVPFIVIVREVAPTVLARTYAQLADMACPAIVVESLHEFAADGITQVPPPLTDVIYVPEPVPDWRKSRLPAAVAGIVSVQPDVPQLWPPFAV